MRDDIAGALNPHSVADAKAQALDLVAVVERDVGDDHAADADGRESADGCQLTGSADLNVDCFEGGLGFLGWKLVRKPPTRCSCDETEALLIIKPVDLVDDPVDVERQVRARFLDRTIMGEHFLRRVAANEKLADRNAETLDALHRLILGVSERLTELTPAMR